MNHVNPYTGSAWKDNPGIACVEFINEQEWGFRRPERWAPETRAAFDAKFQDWLKAKYGTPAGLAAAWGDDSITSFAQAKVPDRFPRRSTDTRTNDFFLLCNKLSMDNVRWMKKVLRDVGYKGLVAQYSIPYGFGGMLPSFEESQVAIVNTYYRHPSAWTRPGSRTDQRSSVGVLGDYWRNAAARRFADRPLFITEFNHSFWNPYQHEGGLVFGAYSALQGFDTLVIHAGSAYFAEGDAVDSFSVGRSPVLRANEFLLNCLFLRRDVAPSPRRVEIDVPEDYMKTDCNSGRLVSTQQSRIALMCGLTVNYPWAERPEGVGKPAAPSAVLSPGEGAELRSAGGGWAVESVESGDATFSLNACVAALKARGILPTANVSDPDSGVYQSDTGEIIIRASENLLKVVTPRSEAATLESGKGELLGQLTVTESSVPALVAACAVDDEALAQSKRIVLIYSTEVVNTGMELSPDRTMLVQLGEQPILMKVGRLRASLRNANHASMSLYALGLDGSRREKLPLEAEGDLVRIQLDTAALRLGPTPFFELVAEE
jgi:hypothetical protein